MAQISSTHSRRVEKYCSQEQFDNNWETTFGKNRKEDNDEEQSTDDSTGSSTPSESGSAR